MYVICMLQNQYNNWAILYMVKDIVINIENVIGIFISKNRFIVLKLNVVFK